MANRRQRAAKAKAKKLALALAYQQREERVKRDNLIKRNLSTPITADERAWRRVTSSVALVQARCSDKAGKKPNPLYHPKHSGGAKPVFREIDRYAKADNREPLPATRYPDNRETWKRPREITVKPMPGKVYDL